MDAKNILVLGVKGSVVAFRRDTGEQLWSTHLKSGSFVTVVTDEKRVYAHTGGALFCLDLFTGDGLWNDPLKGLGYGLGSLAGAGISGAAASNVSELQQQRRRDDTTTVHSSS